MNLRPLSLALGATLALLLPLVASLVPARADQLLQNGTFEDGDAAWSPRVGFSADACAGRSGAGGALQTTAARQTAFVHQALPELIGSGAFTFSGYVNMTAGSPSARAHLIGLDASGEEVRMAPLSLNLTGSYAPFSLAAEPPDAACRLAVRITIDAAAASTLCLDDLLLEGPLATVTPTASPTATSTSTPSATTQPSPSPTGPPATATPSSTPTATRLATSTPTPVAAVDVTSALSNGGFEEGTADWRKFGGELGLSTDAARSGRAAGAFVSSTESTKWAFQVVRVDPGLAYEFEGHVRAGAGIAEAYLRVSWYASDDGSGSALASTDSIRRLSGATDEYVLLDTGAIQPPPLAHSARARVMLAPASSAAATIYLDDFSFGVAAVVASTTTATPSPATPPTTAVAGIDDVAPTAAAGAAVPQSDAAAESEAGPAPPASPVSEVAAAREPPPSDLPAARQIAAAEDGPAALLLLLLGIPVFFVALGLAYAYARRSRRA